MVHPFRQIFLSGDFSSLTHPAHHIKHNGWRQGQVIWRQELGRQDVRGRRSQEAAESLCPRRSSGMSRRPMHFFLPCSRHLCGFCRVRPTDSCSVSSTRHAFDVAPFDAVGPNVRTSRTSASPSQCARASQPSRRQSNSATATRLPSAPPPAPMHDDICDGGGGDATRVLCCPLSLCMLT